jgi:PAS domain S-box-containing protein
MPKSILEYTPFLLAHCSSDLRYLGISNSYAALLGRTPDSVVGKPITELIGPEAFAIMRPRIESVLRGQRVEFEAEVSLAGLGPRHYHIIYVPERDDRDEVIGWVSSITDITEVKKAAEDKARLEKVVAEMHLPHASAQIGIWDWDIHADTVTCTPELEAIFGLPPAGLRRYADLGDLVHPDDIEEVVARRDAAIKAHRTFQLEFRIIRPNGEVRWVMAVGGVVYDKTTDEPIRIMGNSVDITETKASEEEAELQRKELTHLMRVATLGGLSGGIAHELSQPLASILANAQAAREMVTDRTIDRERLAEVLDEIVQQDERAGKVIRHLRKLLQRREHHEAAISLNDLAASTLQLLHSELVNKKIRVDTHLQPDLPSITGDAVELQQVLINLTMNAMEAMASTPASQRTLTISTAETKKGCVSVSIQDRGPGLPPAKEKRIFEPFYTTKAGGLGLGLSISSTIVISHGGELTLNTPPGGGTVATVTLPINAHAANDQHWAPAGVAMGPAHF